MGRRRADAGRGGGGRRLRGGRRGGRSRGGGGGARGAARDQCARGQERHEQRRSQEDVGEQVRRVGPRDVGLPGGPVVDVPDQVAHGRGCECSCHAQRQDPGGAAEPPTAPPRHGGGAGQHREVADVVRRAGCDRGQHAQAEREHDEEAEGGAWPVGSLHGASMLGSATLRVRVDVGRWGVGTG